jgi:hypothetical protein
VARVDGLSGTQLRLANAEVRTTMSWLCWRTFQNVERKAQQMISSSQIAKDAWRDFLATNDADKSAEQLGAEVAHAYEEANLMTAAEDRKCTTQGRNR